METLQQIRVNQVLGKVLEQYAQINIQLVCLKHDAEKGCMQAARARRLSAELAKKALRYSDWAKRIISYYDVWAGQDWFDELAARHPLEDNALRRAMIWAGLRA